MRDTTITSNFIPLESMSVRSWRDTDGQRDTIRVPWMDSLRSDGNFEGSLSVFSRHDNFAVRKIMIGRDLTGGAWQLSGGGVERLDVRHITSNWAGTIHGTIDHFNIKGNASGTLGVDNIRRLFVFGDMIDAKYLVGARLGADARLGGTGVNADQFNGGRVGILEIRGRMVDSIFASSLRTTNDILLDDDDRLIAGQGNSIDYIAVRRGMVNSFFVAPTLPTRATVNFRPVTTQTDNRFIEVLPRNS